jgi:hypothetical protein
MLRKINYAAEACGERRLKADTENYALIAQIVIHKFHAPNIA